MKVRRAVRWCLTPISRRWRSSRAASWSPTTRLRPFQGPALASSAGLSGSRVAAAGRDLGSVEQVGAERPPAARRAIPESMHVAGRERAEQRHRADHQRRDAEACRPLALELGEPRGPSRLNRPTRTGAEPERLPARRNGHCLGADPWPPPIADRNPGPPLLRWPDCRPGRRGTQAIPRPRPGKPAATPLRWRRRRPRGAHPSGAG